MSETQLTKRELEVLKHLAEGNTRVQIGQMLGISPRTVEKHKSNIYQKIGVSHIADLVRYAIQVGISPLEKK